MGAAIFTDLVLADNKWAGFEVEQDGNDVDNVGYLDGALIIGRTTANSATFDAAPHGLITPRTERYWMKNVQFHNFDFTGSVCDGEPADCIKDAAAVGSCSHCYSDR